MEAADKPFPQDKIPAFTFVIAAEVKEDNKPGYNATGMNPSSKLWKAATADRLQAVRGELSDTLARLDAGGAESEVLALCKRFLAFRQEDRPEK